MKYIASLLIMMMLVTTSPCNDEDVEIDISPKMEKAIAKALKYLASKQLEEGCWKGAYGKDVGETSLCLMAFMSLGNLPGEGKYGPQVARGVRWIIKQARPSGLIRYKGQARQAPAMYGHALSTLMLSEAWGQTRRKDVGQVLRRAVNLIIKVQGPKGGWGYKSKPEDGDTSVCVMQALALKSALQAGIYVPQDTIKRALKLIKTRYNEKEKIFGYSSKGWNPGHAGSSAAGTTIMQIVGEKDPKYTSKATVKMIQLLEKKDKRVLSSPHPFYYFYYTSICSYNSGDKYFKRWVKALEPYLLKEQKSDGRWGSKKKLFQTAFAVLAAAMPYRYIPVYQRQR